VSTEVESSNVDAATEMSLSTAGQLLALSAALVPAVGYFAIGLSFHFNSRLARYDPLMLASFQSVPWLAAVGGFTTLIAGVFALMMIVDGIQPSKKLSRTLAVCLLVTFGLVLLYYVVFVNLLLSLSVVAGAAILLAVLRWVKRSGPVSFRRSWILAVILAAISMVSIGSFAISIPSGHVSFSRSSRVADGDYAIIGTSGSQTYLLPCKPNAPVISVNSQMIVSITYNVTRRNSSYGLYQMIANGSWPPIGASTSCPVASNN
jgi:hypothetical protein